MVMTTHRRCVTQSFLFILIKSLNPWVIWNSKRQSDRMLSDHIRGDDDG